MPPSGHGPAARFNLPLEPFLDFGLHPTHSAPAQLNRLGKCALRDAEVDRAARQSGARLDIGKSQDRVRHRQPSWRQSGSDETQAGWAIWAIKRR
jgi:hypothetical protein